MSKSSLALSNLRAVVIVIVLAFHACLAYLASNPAPGAFLQPPYTWEAFPIIDSARWLGFDIFCAWQDVSLMALMFFLSGLLTGPSLARKGARVYMIDRLRRIGLPFAWAVLLLMPIALYPAYAVRTADPSFGGYVQAWFSLPFWPSGPQWFLWQLVALNAMAAGLYFCAPGLLRDFRRFAAWAGEHPVRYYGALAGVGTLVYAPLALLFSPWHWAIGFGPFALQLCRPGLYIAVFFAGMALGSYGLDRGLLACDGPLARRWHWWLGGAVITFFIWAGCTSLTFPTWSEADLGGKLAASLTYAPACIAGGTFMLAIFLRFSRTRARALDSLSANAYTMYLVHYVFVVWLQYALLGSDLPAISKAAVVFTGTFVLSWGASVGLSKLLSGSFAIREKRPIWTVSR
jgi:hypothetical protein